MNLVKKIKNYIIGETKEDKLDIILNHLIDSIELKDDLVIVKTKKNVVVQNEGHFVQINSGAHVMLSKEIHLNPIINMDFNNDFDKLQENLDKAQEEQRRLMLESLEEY